MKKAQIPIVFIFILAIIVAGLLLTWGVTVIFKMTDTADKAAYKKTITDLNQQIQEMFVHEPGSTQLMQLSIPTKIQHFCFTNRDKNIINQDLKYLIENSNFNTLILPLDAYEKTGFSIQNLKGKNNPECIQTKQGILKAKLTTMNTYVQIEKVI